MGHEHDLYELLIGFSAGWIFGMVLDRGIVWMVDVRARWMRARCPDDR